MASQGAPESSGPALRDAASLIPQVQRNLDGVVDALKRAGKPTLAGQAEEVRERVTFLSLAIERTRNA